MRLCSRVGGRAVGLRSCQCPPSQYTLDDSLSVSLLQVYQSAYKAIESMCCYYYEVVMLVSTSSISGYFQ